MLAVLWRILWTPVSARILALVLQLYERNKLKPYFSITIFELRILMCSRDSMLVTGNAQTLTSTESTDRRDFCTEPVPDLQMCGHCSIQMWCRGPWPWPSFFSLSLFTAH